MADQVELLRLPAMRRALTVHAERLEVPVSLDVLCGLAGVRWADAAAAVSVPIGVVGAGRAQTVAAGDLARTGEELQLTLGEGPTLDVLAGSGPMYLDDLATGDAPTRWAIFAPAATAAGICSMAVMPMRVGAARFGAFVVYLERTGGLGPSEGAEAIMLASIALDLLLEELGPTHGTDVTGHADGGESAVGFVDDRPEIHQATGMISIQLGVDLPTALLRLRALAFTENRRLSHLAADVVSRVVRFDAESSPASEPDGAHDDG